MDNRCDLSLSFPQTLEQVCCTKQVTQQHMELHFFVNAQSMMSNSPLLPSFLIPDVSAAWRWYVLYFLEIGLQCELPKPVLRKTKIKVRPRLNSLKVYKWRRLGLKNGWVSDVFPLDNMQVFSSKLTSDSSIFVKNSEVALFWLIVEMFQKASSELWEQGSCWHTNYSHALNWFTWKEKQVCMPLMLTLLKSVTTGEWHTLSIVLKVWHKRELASALTTGLYLCWRMKFWETFMLLWPLIMCLKCVLVVELKERHPLDCKHSAPSYVPLTLPMSVYSEQGWMVLTFLGSKLTHYMPFAFISLASLSNPYQILKFTLPLLLTGQWIM